MTLLEQKSFNWKVVVYLFLGGTGGGLFFIGFILERLKLLVSLARAGEILGLFSSLWGVSFCSSMRDQVLKQRPIFFS